ncbi:hypothetical protein QJS04_geneDACA018547 [Acorus gramineus]|uniref:Uncharacterized protein n=1 Tax=Acorus gramineus TaxID=55184 RepID=A0AAV9BXK9_ACOGR|nr:hypothetical protein QJS04_geneDACA018547 [Acorus gramineus]
MKSVVANIAGLKSEPCRMNSEALPPAAGATKTVIQMNEDLVTLATKDSKQESKNMVSVGGTTLLNLGEYAYVAEENEVFQAEGKVSSDPVGKTSNEFLWGKQIINYMQTWSSHLWINVEKSEEDVKHALDFEKAYKLEFKSSRCSLLKLQEKDLLILQSLTDLSDSLNSSLADLKATTGGGGRGMRLGKEPEESVKLLQKV